MTPRLGLLVSNHDAARALIPALRASRFALAEHCLDGEQLLAAVNLARLDAALVSTGPRALDPTTILTLAARLPLVALDRDPDHPQWQPLAGNVLPMDAPPGDVLDALEAAMRGQRHVRRRVQAEVRRAGAGSPETLVSAPACEVLTVISGYGAPGRSTVAMNLAAILGMVAPTVLVDLDLGGAVLAGVLEGNTSRHVGTLAKSSEQHLPVSRDIQRLHANCSKGWLLAGLPRPDARGLLEPAFMERLMSELRQRFRYVICDTGVQWLHDDTLAAAPITLADRLFLVATPDDPGIWRARQAIEQVRAWWPDSELAIVVNRHRGRVDARRSELEDALRAPLSAILPFDAGACSRAIASHRPVVYDARSRLSKRLIELGRRLYGGTIVMPVEPQRSRGWLRWLPVGQRP